jgi:hypothetical protein
MPRHVAAILSGSVLSIALASVATAQGLASHPVLVGQQAAARGGRVHGLVRDEAGRAISGASVMAVGGAVPVAAKSDTGGQFTLALPPGEYILRATRDGYVSTYREPVRIQSSTQIERTIVLTREGPNVGRLVLMASSPVPASADPAETKGDDAEPDANDPDHSHNEAAWRLRHLTPTALRDISSAGGLEPSSTSAFRPRPSFVDWMMGESARAAASFFTNTNFSGQVNFLTTSSLAAAGSWLPAELPHGIAYLAIGAPVGSQGDWTVRGAMSASTVASWVVLGEYTAREDQPHAFSVGMSYSSQPVASGADLAPLSVNERVRSVGGMYGFDRWHVNSALELDYGVRLDRYDYVAGSEFLSPRLGFRLRLLPETHVTMQASQRVIAPGADEFLPPPSAGPWLPPERTFSPLLPGAFFQAERVRNVDVGIEQQLGRGPNAPAIGVRRFQAAAQDQVATLFGLDSESNVGHYYVATPGSLSADGWVMRISGRLGSRVEGTVDYTTSQAQWTTGSEAFAIAALAPSVVRLSRERLHDVTTSVNATIPETSTKVLMAYRINTGFSVPDSALPVAAGRFDVELRQALPLRPTRASRTELVVVVRNLFRDLGDAGSLYDELLTVAPPMRIMGGVQVKF